MTEIRQTAEFAKWLKALRDIRAKAKVLVRIERLADGNSGNVKAVGGGVSELKIDFGPGYRVYFANRGEALIILLTGGDKDSQADDVKKAKRILSELED